MDMKDYELTEEQKVESQNIAKSLNAFINEKYSTDLDANEGNIEQVKVNNVVRLDLIKNVMADMVDGMPGIFRAILLALWLKEIELYSKKLIEEAPDKQSKAETSNETVPQGETLQ